MVTVSNAVLSDIAQAFKLLRPTVSIAGNKVIITSKGTSATLPLSQGISKSGANR